MSRQLRWTRRALRRLELISDFIAQENSATADSVNERLRSATEKLRAYPALGRPGRIPGTRELVLTDIPDIIAYRVTEAKIEMLTIIHTSQRWPEKL